MVSTFDMISMFHLIPRIYTLHWVEAHIFDKTRTPKIDAQYDWIVGT